MQKGLHGGRFSPFCRWLNVSGASPSSARTSRTSTDGICRRCMRVRTAWTAGKDELVKAIPTLAEWQGKMGESAASLLAAMTAWEKTSLAGRAPLRVCVPDL